MSKSLRNQVIRLAHLNPNLRSSLLPLLRQASREPYYSWVRQFPQVAEQHFAAMQQYAHQEGTEVNDDPRESLTMIVSDMGWAGTALPVNKHHWVWQLASALRVDVKAEWEASR
jgi:hypothetical protein